MIDRIRANRDLELANEAQPEEVLPRTSGTVTLKFPHAAFTLEVGGKTVILSSEPTHFTKEELLTVVRLASVSSVPLTITYDEEA